MERVFSKFTREIPKITAAYTSSTVADEIAATILGTSSGREGTEKRRLVVSGKRIVPFMKAKIKTALVAMMKITARIKRERKILFLETKVIVSAYREDKFM